MIRLSQRELVKRWLLGGKSITPVQALSHYNIWRLASIIDRLKMDGLNIKNEGKKGKQAKYIIEDENTLETISKS